MLGVIEPFGNLYRIIVLGDAQNYIEKDPNCMGKSSMSDNNGTRPPTEKKTTNDLCRATVPHETNKGQQGTGK